VADGVNAPVTMDDRRNSLRVSEIFFSLQGEASRVGLPTVFVRLTGCPLRCRWCDTAHAFSGGSAMSLDDVLARVAAHPTRQVTVTGGEPLAQRACLPLLTALCDAGYEVSLETSGALPIADVDSRVSRIVDLKPPASGECERNDWANLAHLTASDELKVVIADRGDYQWAKQALLTYGLSRRCPILFSPVHGELPPADLAQWILDDGLPVRFQIQLHKILWGNVAGR
jgi:7-carboxy-7-deazaguanine synthase